MQENRRQSPNKLTYFPRGENMKDGIFVDMNIIKKQNNLRLSKSNNSLSPLLPGETPESESIGGDTLDPKSSLHLPPRYTKSNHFQPYQVEN